MVRQGIGIVLLVITVVVCSFAVQDSFATHLSDNVKWQLVYVTGNPACGNYDYQMTHKYSVISSKYLELYKLNNTSYESLCISEEKYQSDYHAPLDLDLLVVVYEKNLGREYLQGNLMGGIYSHTGDDRAFNHVIAICDCPNFNFSDPVWILSHELSHFVLSYKGFDLSTIESKVHEKDAQYDKCVKSHQSCKGVETKIKVDSMSYSFNVISPYTPAIGAIVKPTNEITVDSKVEALGKMITKWWADGKISESDYKDTLGLLSEANKNAKSNEILIMDGPIDKTPTWKEHASYKDNYQKTLDIAQSLKTDEQKQGLYGDEELPDWFKQNAKWWVEGKITNEEYVRGIVFLEKSGLINSK